MDKTIIKKYIDMEGNVKERTKFRRISVVIFAGIKFLFDRFLAILGLIVCLPLMLLIAIAIKIDSKGPILFKQKRTGKFGKEFTAYKFRTMVADNNVYDLSKADEHTKVGKILRATSLDELPQLISIATAKMSFIGPRPWIVDYYENMTDAQRQRYIVRPGLTGLAQVMGRNDISIIKKIQYDLDYIKNYSLKQDLKIIFLTIKVVYTGKGSDAGKDTIQKELQELKKYNNKRKK